jgi:hypothetical protein
VPHGRYASAAHSCLPFAHHWGESARPPFAKPLPDTQRVLRVDLDTCEMSSRGLRDHGFDRIGRTTRYFAIGAIVVGGVFSAAVAKALPGRSSHHSTSPAAGSGGGAPASGSGASDSGSAVSGGGATSVNPVQSDPSLSQPAQAPQPSYSPPVVSSGGS